MFIYTVKASTLKFFAVLFISVAVLAALIAVVPVYSAGGEVASVDIAYGGIKNEADVYDFLKGLGWSVGAECETETVVIPEEFDSAYTEYNNLQRSQGLDLSDYRGKTATRYSYYINGADDYTGKIMITVLICGNRVIAGDVTGLGKESFVKSILDV